MKNVDIKVDGQKVILTISLKDLLANATPSVSGKTMIVASTGGNVSVPGHKDLKIGLNAYVPNQAEKGAGAATN